MGYFATTVDQINHHLSLTIYISRETCTTGLSLYGAHFDQRTYNYHEVEHLDLPQSGLLRYNHWSNRSLIIVNYLHCWRNV